jgi:DNA-binding transcriptional LysR family regulator
MIDLNEMQIFVAVSEARSFTLAAKRLSIPKSNVSRAVAKLEARLGARLLDRTTRRVTPTEVGETYLEHCTRVLQAAEDADLSVDAAQAKPRGDLRVAVYIGFFNLLPPLMLRNFMDEHPDLRLQFQAYGSTGPTGDKAIDLSIRGGRLEDSDFLVRSILRVSLGAYVSPSYLTDRASPKSPADLNRHHCLTAEGMFGDQADPTIWRFRRGSTIKEIKIESRISIPAPNTYHQLALVGAGIAILPQAVARVDVEEGRLVRVLPDWEPDPFEISAVYPSRLNASPKVRTFIEFLQRCVTSESVVKSEERRAAESRRCVHRRKAKAE